MKRYLIPAPGLIVRDPLTGAAMPARGAHVDINPYWQRRLTTGDVRAGKPATRKPRKRKTPTEDSTS